MKINAITINGFRAWKHEIRLDLAADAVIIIARNGQGKTSLLDAIMWSLTGSVPRLGDDHLLLSKYSETGQAFVSIDLQDPTTEKTLKISRLFDGTSQSVQVEHDGSVLTGVGATQRIIEVLWPTATSAPKPVEALIAAFTRSIYLQQDRVRDFIQDQEKQARFIAVSEIIGTGRVTELQIQLDRAKTAWTKASNERYEESSSLRKRLTVVREQLSAMIASAGPANLGALEIQWKSWWRETGLILNEEPGVLVASPRAANVLDHAIKQLYSVEMALGRKMDEIRETLSFLQKKPSTYLVSAALPVADRLKIVDLEVEKLTLEFNNLREQQKTFESVQVERAKSHSQMVQLARLALQHLSERCPVCDQTYDANATRSRLEELLKETGLQVASDGFEKEIAVKADDLSKLIERRSLILSEKRNEELMNERLRLWESERKRRLEVFSESLSDEEVTQKILVRTSEIHEEMLKIQRLRKVGEEIALKIASTSEVQRRAELRQEVDKLTDASERAELELVQRNKTGELAGHILNALRESAGELVKNQLREIEPVLQRIYETCDPHPALKVVRLVSGMFRGRGQLDTVIEDPENENVRSDDPARILSSSQINVLAVSLFLALNLTVRSLPLQCAILDDPLQSLDDLNLLGLIDVLRHVKDQRQMFISTHDLRFGMLLRRKLRPVNPGQRTRIIEINDWSREGPVIHQYDALHEITVAQAL